jgi:hypothetical protein
MMTCVLGVVDACWLGSEYSYGRDSGRGRRQEVVGNGTAGIVGSGVSSSFLCRGVAVASDGWSENWNESEIQARPESGLKCRRYCRNDLVPRRGLGIGPALGPVICEALEGRDVSEAAAGSANEPGSVADSGLEQTWNCLREAADTIGLVTVWAELWEETLGRVGTAKVSIQVPEGAEPDREAE